MPGTFPYSFLLQAALKSSLLISAAFLATLLLRKGSAALRHVVWTAAFLAVLLMPILSTGLPAWRVPLDGAVLSTGFVFRLPAQPPAELNPAAQSISNQRTTTQARPRRSFPWGGLLALVWLAGMIVAFVRMLIGLAVVARLRRRASLLKLPDFTPLTELLGINVHVDLFQAEKAGMPIASGFFRPAIFLPADAAEWTPECRRAVLLHELAHVRRRDVMTHLLARTAVSLYWWNPLFWAAWRRFLNERERAADDLVLNLGARASDYASHLLAIASSLQFRAAFGYGAVPMARPSQLAQRVSAILDPAPDRSLPRRASVLAASFVAILILCPIAALQAGSDTAQPAQAKAANIGPVAAFLIQQADLARDQGKLDQARTNYRQALTMLGGNPQAAGVLIHLGTVELSAKNFDQAISNFERAQAFDPATSGDAKMWMAVAQQRQNNLAAAEALYQTALAAAPPDSISAAVILQLYAGLLQQQGRVDEANTLQKRSAGILAAPPSQSAFANHPSASDAYRIGGDVTAPLLLSKVEPDYTADARIAKYQGSALLSIEIGADGLATNIQIVHSLGLGLDQKAIEALRRWKFKPATRNGQPVKVIANVEINFRLL